MDPSPEPEAWTIRVPADAAGTRIDRFLAEARADLSRARIQALLAEGAVTLEGRPLTRAAERLREGQQVALRLPPAKPAGVEAQAIPLRIVHEDADLLVVDKPAGMVTHPAPGSPDRTLVNALLAHCPDLSGIGGVTRPGIVHRLDKDTSGLLVVAKTDRAHRDLSAQIAAKTARREYLAVAHGVLRDRQGRVEAPIGRHPRERTRMAVVPGGRSAATRWEVLEDYGLACLLRLSLETGRTHQIRVHMAHLGHPLVGDPVYAGHRTFPVRIGRQALHAHSLAFRHPTTGEELTFTAEPPPDLARLVEALRARTR